MTELRARMVMVPHSLTESSLAVFSWPNDEYRYRLVRTWDENGSRCCFVLLNPSTADARNLDATNRRGIGYARAWGHGSVEFVNLYALRTPEPKVLKAAIKEAGDFGDYRAAGPLNETYIAMAVAEADHVVAAWGTNPSDRWVTHHLRGILHDVPMVCLGTNDDGSPVHPLRQAKDATLQAWDPEEWLEAPQAQMGEDGAGSSGLL